MVFPPSLGVARSALEAEPAAHFSSKRIVHHHQRDGVGPILTESPGTSIAPRKMRSLATFRFDLKFELPINLEGREVGARVLEKALNGSSWSRSGPLAKNAECPQCKA